MIILTDKEVALIITRKLYHREEIEGESPSFKVRTTKTSVMVSHKGGEPDPEALIIAPQLLNPKMPTRPKLPTITELEEDYENGLTGLPFANNSASSTVFKTRLAICRNCIEWLEDENHPIGYCDKAGRGTKLIWVKNETCPDNKWINTQGSQP